MASLNLYNYESKYIANLIRTHNLSGRRFPSTCQFINEVKTSNDAGEFRQAFFPIYWTKLVLKVKYNGSHATFLDLDISIDKHKSIYNMFDKRVAFNCCSVRMFKTLLECLKF